MRKAGVRRKFKVGNWEEFSKLIPLWTQERLPKSLGPVEDYWKLEANQKSKAVHRVMLNKNKAIILKSDSFCAKESISQSQCKEWEKCIIYVNWWWAVQCLANKRLFPKINFSKINTEKENKNKEEEEEEEITIVTVWWCAARLYLSECW